ncbi:MAG: pantetheine-phosphate adenylyltransferase [Bacilli bacterium]|nr:pantetheine-phosphate adenylyltransferase [Bacilli bacterium]
MKIAVYPGSFDPISNGHLDIVERTSKVFDKVYVLVSLNPNKTYIFTPDERVALLKEATKHLDNVIVEASNQLVLDYAKERNCSVIIRGMRNIYDYQSEITLFQFNHTIDNTIDTYILFPSTDNLFLSSSAIKELVMFNKPIDAFVPNGMAEKITKIIKERQK